VSQPPPPPGADDAIVRGAVEFLAGRRPAAPEIAVVLGSGLGAFADRLEGADPVPYGDIPGLPRPTVSGHQGRLVFGTLGGRRLVCMQGRLHLYEGIGPAEVTFGVRVFAGLGVRILVLTTASGGIHRHYRPGDIMLIEDQVNIQMRNPVVVDGRPGAPRDGAGDAWSHSGPVYSPRLLQVARDVAREIGEHHLHRGVFGGVLGPSYETPAEVRMLRALGADAVSMSTVLESITARSLGLEVLGISAIVNAASGLTDAPLNHEEVLEGAKQMEERLLRYLGALVPRLTPDA
jgi:purine-nucleoside phosphorylase